MLDLIKQSNPEVAQLGIDSSLFRKHEKNHMFSTFFNTLTSFNISETIAGDPAAAGSALIENVQFPDSTRKYFASKIVNLFF